MNTLALLSILCFITAAGSIFYLQHQYPDEELNEIQERVDRGTCTDVDKVLYRFGLFMLILIVLGGFFGVLWILGYIFG